jgi:hypothetical protein
MYLVRGVQPSSLKCNPSTPLQTLNAPDGTVKLVGTTVQVSDAIPACIMNALLVLKTESSSN